MDKTDWLSWALLFSLVQLASSRALSPYGIMEYFQILVSCMMYWLAKSWNFVVCGKSSSSLIFRTSCHTRGEMIDDGPMSSEIREQNWSLIRIRVLRTDFVSSFDQTKTPRMLEHQPQSTYGPSNNSYIRLYYIPYFLPTVWDFSIVLFEKSHMIL